MADPNGPQWSALQRRIDRHFTRAYELDRKAAQLRDCERSAAG